MSRSGSSNQEVHKHYFINPVVDFALVGGISILAFFLLFFITGDTRPAWIAALSGVLVWVGNWPHFAATNYRLYRRMDTIREYPLTATLVPIVILAGMWLALIHPETIAPYFVKLFLIWSPYHFSGQTVGITLLYARRSGFEVSKSTRQYLSLFVFGTFLVGTAKFETNSSGATYYGVAYPGFGIPVWVPDALAVIMGIGGLLFLLEYVRQSVGRGKFFPLIILVPGIAQLFWFVLGVGVPGFVEFVPFFHSVQYLLIASSMQLVEESENPKVRSQRHLALSMLQWSIGIFILGALLFYVFPRFVSSLGVPFTLALGITLAGVQIHHFFVDGVIWKLKRRTVSKPLMENAPAVFRSFRQGAEGKEG